MSTTSFVYGVERKKTLGRAGHLEVAREAVRSVMCAVQQKHGNYKSVERGKSGFHRTISHSKILTVKANPRRISAAAGGCVEWKLLEVVALPSSTSAAR